MIASNSGLTISGKEKRKRKEEKEVEKEKKIKEKKEKEINHEAKAIKVMIVINCLQKHEFDCVHSKGNQRERKEK